MFVYGGVDIPISAGIRSIWVVFVCEHDHSGDPEMLAAYDGDSAAASAFGLADLIRKAGCTRNVVPVEVPLWPLLKVSP